MAASRRVTLSDLTGAAARRLRRESSDLANALAIYRLPSLSGRTPEALAVTPAPLRKGGRDVDDLQLSVTVRSSF